MNLTITFGLTSIALAVAVWHCYKTNKPLRVKAREEAEAKARKKAVDEAEGREKNRRAQFRKELYSDLEQAIATPYILEETRLGTYESGVYRWKRLAEFIRAVSALKQDAERVANLEGRVATQSKLIRDLQLQQKEILKALQLGQPIE